MSKVDLEEPTPMSDKVYLVFAQKNCNRKARVCAQKLVSFSTTTKFNTDRKSDVASWSYDMKGHAQKCVESNCESAHQSVEQLLRFSSLDLDDGRLKRKR